MKQDKLGYQSPKNWRNKYFQEISIKGDLHYCKSHNFVYNADEQERLLYDAKPNFYTDSRFDDSNINFYKEARLFWSRTRTISDRKIKPDKLTSIFRKKSNKPVKRKFKNSLSLKSCIRLIKKCKGIPVGTIVEFNTCWYYTKAKIDTRYKYKVKKLNDKTINYEISIDSYFHNFNDCEFSQSLTNKLREEGFLVQVYNSNPNRLIGEEEGEIAIAYGYGKKIGYSSKRNNFRGYYDGRENILYDKFGEFCKWSRCLHISKDTSIDEILNILKTENTD